MTPDDELKYTRERLIRWEDNRRKQLGITNNVVLTLATGLLGFLYTHFDECRKGCNIFYVACATIFLGTSILSALIGSLTRLHDYKQTAEVICLKKQELEKGVNNKEQKNKLRKQNEHLGQWTWVMLYFQIVSFILGSFFIICFLNR